MPAHQRVHADREHGAHQFRRQRFAHAHRVRDDEVVLQLLHQRLVVRLGIAAGQFVAGAMRAEQLVGVAAETGGDAVDRLATLDLRGEEIRGALHALELFRVEADVGVAARDFGDLRARQACAVEVDCLAHCRIAPECIAPVSSIFHAQRFDEIGARHFELILLAHVLHRDDAFGDFVRTEHDNETNPGAVGILELLAELAAFENDFRGDARTAKLARDVEILRQDALRPFA